MDEALNSKNKIVGPNISNSFEIDHNQKSGRDEDGRSSSKIMEDINPAHNSISLMDASNNFMALDSALFGISSEHKYSQQAGDNPQNNSSDEYLQGAMLMGITTLFWSTYHI